MSFPPRPPSVEMTGSAAPGSRASAVTPLLEAALAQALAAARPDAVAELAALNVETTATLASDAPLLARAWVERATRTLAFVSGEVFDAEGARVASGAAVFELGAAASAALNESVAAAD